MTRGGFYPTTLNENVNPWNNINVIVETTQELCGHEDHSNKAECYVEEIKNILLAKNFLYNIRENSFITEASFE